MELKEQLIKRLKSLLWRAGMMTVALLVAELTQVLGILELPESVTLVVGLILGEISKYLNSQIKVGKTTKMIK